MVVEVILLPFPPVALSVAPWTVTERARQARSEGRRGTPLATALMLRPLTPARTPVYIKEDVK